MNQLLFLNEVKTMIWTTILQLLYVTISNTYSSNFLFLHVTYIKFIEYRVEFVIDHSAQLCIYICGVSHENSQLAVKSNQMCPGPHFNSDQNMTEIPSTRSLFSFIINQLDAQNLFYNKFISCLYMFRAPCAHRQEVKTVLYSLWYHHSYRWPSRARDDHL